MAKTTVIPESNWPGYLGTVVPQLDDGDKVIVSTEAKAELLRRAIARNRPGLKITIKVQGEGEK